VFMVMIKDGNLVSVIISAFILKLIMFAALKVS